MFPNDLELNLEDIDTLEVSGYTQRKDCTGCRRPESVCLCQYFPKEKLKLNTRVVVIKSPQEERKSRLNTINLLQRVIECDVIISNSISKRNTVWQSLKALSDDHNIPMAVLYPTKSAVPLKEYVENVIQPRQENIKPDVTIPSCILFVLDATWLVAPKMYGKSIVLHDLPAISVKVERSLGYTRIRKEPDNRPDGVSTMEAIAECVQHLEPATGNHIDDLYDIITKPLAELIRQQIAYKDAPKASDDVNE